MKKGKTPFVNANFFDLKEQTPEMSHSLMIAAGAGGGNRLTPSIIPASPPPTLLRHQNVLVWINQPSPSFFLNARL
jgi:hypothetical protein